MRLIFSMLLTGTTLASWTVSAQEVVRVDEFLSQILSMGEAQCQRNALDPALADYEKRGEVLNADVLKGARKVTCECVPEGVRQSLKTLPSSERAKEGDPIMLGRQYVQPIAAKCLAQMSRSMFDEKCEVRYAKLRMGSARYCSCMAAFMTRLSDTDLYELAQSNDEYLRATDEIKRRVPLSKYKPIVEKYVTEEGKCSAEGRNSPK